MFIDIEITEREYIEIRQLHEILSKTRKLPYAEKAIERIISCAQNKTKTERNSEIVKLRKQGLSYSDIGLRYGLTRERVRQIVRNHERRDELTKEAQRKSAHQPRFYKCLLESVDEIGALESTATRAYHCLESAGIVERIESGSATLDDYSDRYLLNIRGMGVTLLELCRDANKRYINLLESESIND